MRQKLKELIDVVFGMRKFIAWLFLFFVGIAFRLSNYMDGAQFVDLVKSTFLAFCAANGIEHFMGVAKDFVKAKAGVPTAAAEEEEK